MSTKVWSMVRVESVLELLTRSIAPSALQSNCQLFLGDYSFQPQHDATVFDTEVGTTRKLNIDRRYGDEEYFQREVVLRELTEQRFGGLNCDAPTQYVTLDQAAAIVGRAKKTVERAINADLDAPKPDIEGGGGRRHEWIWSRLRPWLENEYGRILPERYPVLR